MLHFVNEKNKLAEDESWFWIYLSSGCFQVCIFSWWIWFEVVIWSHKTREAPLLMVQSCSWLSRSGCMSRTWYRGSRARSLVCRPWLRMKSPAQDGSAPICIIWASSFFCAMGGSEDASSAFIYLFGLTGSPGGRRNGKVRFMGNQSKCRWRLNVQSAFTS